MDEVSDVIEPQDQELAPIEGGLLEFAHAERNAERKCIFARARESLAPEHRRELDYMVNNREEYSVSVIYRAINAIGYTMSRASVDHHLRGECPCVR